MLVMVPSWPDWMVTPARGSWLWPSRTIPRRDCAWEKLSSGTKKKGNRLKGRRASARRVELFIVGTSFVGRKYNESGIFLTKKIPLQGELQGDDIGIRRHYYFPAGTSLWISRYAFDSTAKVGLLDFGCSESGWSKSEEAAVVGNSLPLEGFAVELLPARKLTYTKEAMLSPTSRPVMDLRVTSFFMVEPVFVD